MAKPRTYLRGYSWDASVQRYRYAATGRYVARRVIIEKMELSQEQRERRAQKSTQRFVDGNMAMSTWYFTQRDMLKRQYLQNAAIAAGGWENLTARDFGHIGGVLNAEYRRLRNMARQIAEGEVSMAQALNRTAMYYGGARAEYWKTKERHQPEAPPGMSYIQRRILNPAEHCLDCLKYYAQGWRPRGVLPAPTVDCACGNNCRCDKIQALVPRADLDLWIGTKRAAPGGVT